MSERHEPACPMMRAATGLQHNLGRLELAEEGFDLAPSELAAQHRAVLLVDTVQREHVLGRVDRNALKLHEDGPSLEHDSPTSARDAVGPSTPTTGIPALKGSKLMPACISPARPSCRGVMAGGWSRRAAATGDGTGCPSPAPPGCAQTALGSTPRALGPRRPLRHSIHALGSWRPQIRDRCCIAPALVPSHGRARSRARGADHASHARTTGVADR